MSHKFFSNNGCNHYDGIRFLLVGRNADAVMVVALFVNACCLFGG